MATFAAAKTPGMFVRGPKPQSLLEGNEGQVLTKIITQVSGDEPIKRLVRSLEKANEKRQEELKCYINSLRCEAESAHECEFTIDVIDYSWQVWQKLSECFFTQGVCLEVPDACPGYDNNFMYTWSRAEHYLECEIFGSGAVEFFYRNRKTSEVWGEDTTLEHGFSNAVLEKAALFAW